MIASQSSPARTFTPAATPPNRAFPIFCVSTLPNRSDNTFARSPAWS